MPTAPLSEPEALARAAAGDAEAFEALVSPHLPMLYNSILRILGEPADAQDALQEALLAIHRDLPRFEGRSAFSSWAYRICINNALMLRRTRVRRREDAVEDLMSQEGDDGRPRETGAFQPWSTEAEAPADLERAELRAKMMAVLNRMSDAQRAVFILRDLEDWSYEDIAERLGVTQAVVRQRLHRARLFLQERMRPFVLGRPR